jgi:hypothetical protein
MDQKGIHKAVHSVSSPAAHFSQHPECRVVILVPFPEI